MKKILTLILLSMIAFNAINAEITWNLSNDGTLTISGTDMPAYTILHYDDNPYNETYITTPWYSQRDEIKHVVIENGVTNIGAMAFAFLPALTSIEIPNSVTSIGSEPFLGCYNLTSIDIPNSVTVLEDYALSGNGLTSVIIPNSVTAISEGLFDGCENLKSVEIPNSVTSIGELAFHGCISLTSIEIPNSVTSIGSDAFYGTPSLEAVNIPNSVTVIEDGTFDQSGLTSIIIPNSVTHIGDWAFYGCPLTLISVEEGNKKYDSRNNCNAIIETESNALIQGSSNTIIPNTVTTIKANAFSCSGLTSIEIPNSVTSIGVGAFSYCSSLTSITLPNTLTTIAQGLFNGCSSLFSVYIPSSVTSIGRYAFYDCSSLTYITCGAISPPECGSWTFYGVNHAIPVYVQDNSIDEYKAANEWKDFNIQPSTISITDDEYCQLSEQGIFYTRTFYNTAWQALYIPFSLSYSDWENDFEVAYINGIRQLDTDDDGIIDNTIMDIVKIKEGSLIPNTPYLIKAKTTGKKTISNKNTTIYKEERSIDCSTTIAKYTFTGTYNTILAATLIENNYYAMGGGSLIMTDGTSNLNPFRWYFKVEPRSQMYNISESAKIISINVVGEESETTGINEQRVVNDKSPIYDLNGRVVNENTMKPGIYIKNGKKVVIK